MNGVVGSIDLLRETGVTDEQRELLELLRRSALAQLSLLEDLIDVSQGEVGTIELESMPLQLGEAIHGVSAMLERDAADRGLSISVFVDPAIPPKLLGDARRIRQVLFNLVRNAIKFSGGGTVRGEVTLRALLAARESDVASIDLVVADRGIGMDTATVEKLFSPFSQADASITRRHGGTGTGLALSSMLVRRMGGTLSVESVPGQGSTFTARLRLRLPPPPAAARRPGPPGASARRPLVPPVPVPSQEEARRQGRLVLVAEDNDMNRRVIARQMELIGFAVQLAVDGREALERWRSGDFGLLLTDLHMPELDGYALATAIRAEEKGGPRKPIIALTANSLRDEALRCFAAGIDAYLTKPVQLPRLKAAIEAGLAGTLADAEWKAV
jgi:CheY-like chemotaxis protein